MFSFHCHACDKETVVLSIKEASAVVQTTRRTIQRWIAADRVHVLKNPGGRTFVCQASLLTSRSSRDAEQRFEG